MSVQVATPMIRFEANVPVSRQSHSLQTTILHWVHPLIWTGCHVANEMLSYEPGTEIALGVMDAAFLTRHGYTNARRVRYVGGLSQKH